MGFFIWTKSNVSFSRYRDFCVFVKCKDFKICYVIISIATSWKLHLYLFLLNPKSYQMKLDQILVCSMAHISNMFLAQCWRLETSFRLSYDFIKMAIERNLAFFNSWHFFNCPLFTLKKNETLESWNSWLLSDLSRWLNWNWPGT